MPEFILDSSGIVLGTPKPRAGGGVKADGAWTFTALDSFTQGYIEALFFTETSCIPMAEWYSEESQERVREGQADGCLPTDSGFKDLAPETLERIIEDCRKFQSDARELLTAAYGNALQEYDEAQAGRDFWYTRNGHGCGFWDRGLGDVGDQLSALCGWRTSFPETDAYLGDDGKVHLS